jgi:hypothetical protein
MVPVTTGSGISLEAVSKPPKARVFDSAKADFSGF